MKTNQLCSSVFFVALILVAGCHHKISPIAPIDQRPFKAAPSSTASLLVRARSTPDPEWSDLNAAMEKMHTAAASVESSGNSDMDFVRLMMPHHQAAIEMAKAQLLYGKDPQMRRLAQEIITDQQSEIDLMQLWVKHTGRKK